MAVKDILERIEGDAGDSLQALRAKLRRKLDELQAHHEARLTRLRGEGKERNGLAARQEKERLLTMGRLELRKANLGERRRRIDQTFDLARQQMLDLDDEARKRWLFALVLEGAEGGDEGLLLAPRDRKLFAGRDLETLNEALKASGRLGTVTLVEDGPSPEGGCILVADDYEINRSLESLLREARDVLEEEVASLLFEKGD